MPVGDATFASIAVKILQGAEQLCVEEFSNVSVQSSTLNLSIGKNISCALEEVVAEHTNLSFQVCIGGSSNCLSPVELGSTPYAIKATYASAAQEAQKANEAAVAHYAHRATADRDMFLNSALGTGYFDFYTHPVSDTAGIYPNSGDYDRYSNGGYIQWTPVRDPIASSKANTLHIAGKAQDDTLRELAETIVVSDQTRLSGNVVVYGNAGYPGADNLLASQGIASIDALTKGLLVVSLGAEIIGSTRIFGTSTTDHALTVKRHCVMNAGDGSCSAVGDGLRVEGNSQVVNGQLVVDSTGNAVTYDANYGLRVNDKGVMVTGSSVVSASESGVPALTVTHTGASPETALRVEGDSRLTGKLLVAAQAGDSALLDRTLEVTGGGAYIVGTTTMSNDVQVDGELRVSSNATFKGDLRVEGVVGSQDNNIIFDSQLYLDNGLEVTALTATDNAEISIDMGDGGTPTSLIDVDGSNHLHINKGAGFATTTIGGQVTMNNGLTVVGDMNISQTLSVDTISAANGNTLTLGTSGTAVKIEGPLNVAESLEVNGSLTVKGDMDFTNSSFDFKFPENPSESTRCMTVATSLPENECQITKVGSLFKMTCLCRSGDTQSCEATGIQWSNAPYNSCNSHCTNNSYNTPACRGCLLGLPGSSWASGKSPFYNCDSSVCRRCDKGTVVVSVAEPMRCCSIEMKE